MRNHLLLAVPLLAAASTTLVAQGPFSYQSTTFFGGTFQASAPQQNAFGGMFPDMVPAPADPTTINVSSTMTASASGFLGSIQGQFPDVCQSTLSAHVTNFSGATPGASTTATVAGDSDTLEITFDSQGAVDTSINRSGEAGSQIGISGSFAAYGLNPLPEAYAAVQFTLGATSTIELSGSVARQDMAGPNSSLRGTTTARATMFVVNPMTGGLGAPIPLFSLAALQNGSALFPPTQFNGVPPGDYVLILWYTSNSTVRTASPNCSVSVNATSTTAHAEGKVTLQIL